MLEFSLEQSFELKDIDTTKRTFVGAFASFDTEDSHKDVIEKKAFTKTFSENIDRVRHLMNHDTSKPVGKVQRLWADHFFAFYESKIGTHALGNDALEMATSGLLPEHSFGYKVINYKKRSTGGRELNELKLFEVSNITAWGSNPNTTFLQSFKGLNSEDLLTKLAEREKALERFCRNSTCTDETIEALLFECKKLNKEIYDIKTNSTKPPLNGTLPQTFIGKITI